MLRSRRASARPARYCKPLMLCPAASSSGRRSILATLAIAATKARTTITRESAATSAATPAPAAVSTATSAVAGIAASVTRRCHPSLAMRCWRPRYSASIAILCASFASSCPSPLLPREFVCEPFAAGNLPVPGRGSRRRIAHGTGRRIHGCHCAAPSTTRTTRPNQPVFSRSKSASAYRAVT
jgi:hypothetical protein